MDKIRQILIRKKNAPDGLLSPMEVEAIKQQDKKMQKVIDQFFNDMNQEGKNDA